MDRDRSVTATFNKDTPHQVRLDGTLQTYHSSIISAYLAAGSDDTIRVWGTDFSEDFTFNQDKSVTLKGGYNQAYTANDDYTTLHGILIVKSGALTVDKLVIK